MGVVEQAGDEAEDAFAIVRGQGDGELGELFEIEGLGVVCSSRARTHVAVF